MISIGVDKPHALAATRLVQRLHGRRPRQPAEGVQIRFAVGGKGQRDKLRIPELGDMHMVGRAGAAHVQRIGSPIGAHESEIGEELFRAGQVRDPHAYVGQVGDFDGGHCLDLQQD